MKARSSRPLSSRPYIPREWNCFASHRHECHTQSIARFWNRPHLPLRLVAGFYRDTQVLQKMPHEAFRLHVSEVQPKTHMCATSERYPSEPVTAALRFVGKAHRVEAVGIGPYLRHVMGEHRIDADHRARRHSVAFEIEIANGASRDR